ncbi:MAG: preprotein translocase subunit YajC [Clostridiales bacterium]|jgi:preprotein translocase subunit YajC|nr:preprotein translocase subunit YajC [Clostridiales bacterium]
MRQLLRKIWPGALPFVFGAVGAAADSGAVDPAAAGGLASFLPLLGYLAFFGVVMYLMVYMPQKRKDKKAKELLNSLQVGYRVTLHSGIVGKIVNLKDDVVTVESSVERTQIEVKKWAIKDVDKPVEA